VTDEIRAAGAVVRQSAGHRADVLLVHRPKYGDWSLPKGKLEPGEHMLLAAVREVAEETGLQVTLGRRLPAVHYLSDGVPKRVDYWVATAGQDPLAEFLPNSEIDGIAWVATQGAATAGTELTYGRDVETVAAALTGPSATTPLILVRHAEAGHKSDWPGDDLSRPLDRQGELDARSLAPLLRCFGVSRVISAPAERCLATVRPYAAAIGGVIETEPAFDVTSAGAGRAGVDAKKAAAALAAAAEPVIICAHRENLPVLLAAACAELGAGPPAGPPLRKGEFLVLHRAGGRLIAAERYHPDGR
jgi:8-oxo-(d)GTP phosphatase